MAKNGEYEKYAYLDRLSTPQLEELLRADSESCDEGDWDVIFHILEVIERRETGHPAWRPPSEDEAWEEFQQYYNIPEGEGLSLYPTGEPDHIPEQPRRPLRLRPVFRIAGVAAAIVVGIFAVLVVAQASGLDVFGALGRWTDETFHFEIMPNETNQSNEIAATFSDDNAIYTALQTALDDCGITEQLAPLWYPESFTASAPKVLRLKFGDNILYNFTGDEDKFFALQIRRYNSASDLALHEFEKDTSSMEAHIGAGKAFYIMSNIDTATATWSDGLSLVFDISGNISVDEIKAMIDSIGGN